MNYLSDPGQEQVAVSYGTKYHRLRSVKATWDPDNVFRHNANITPASPE
ncbi:BBE domain-containing protein [Nocardia sp. MW-W600-9]